MATQMQNYISNVKIPTKASNTGLSSYLSTQKINPIVPTPQKGTGVSGVSTSQTPTNTAQSVLRTASPAAASPVVKSTQTQAPQQASAPAPQVQYTAPKPIQSPAYNDYLSQYSNAVQTSTAKTDRADKKKSEEQNAYLKYLQTMFDPKQARMAQENVNRLNEQISRETLRARDAEDAIRENKQGQLSFGQGSDLSELARTSSRNLGDLAIAKGYATDILEQYTNAGATLYEAEQAAQKEANELLSVADAIALGVPYGITRGEARQMGVIPVSQEDTGFSLSEGQARYDAQGNLIAQRGKTYAPGTGSSSSTSGGIVGADGKPIRLLAGQVDTIANYDNTLSSAQRALELLESSGVSTGPFANLILQGKKFAGYGDEKQLQLEQLLGKLRADFMKAISGAAVSEQEVKRLSKFLPDLGDQENVIKSKLNNLLTEVANSKDVFVRTVGGVSSQGSVSAPQQMQARDGTIYTLQPDGTYQ